ncbi:hypothetical protein FACS1894181_06320 [Bacteroidia bacterium]|nr:hypothetical protein FACS1894181_06320 [Bacteroidia bacterium]
MKAKSFLNVRRRIVGGFGLSMAMALMLLLASCQKDDEKSSGRDQFVGSYAYVIEGELRLNFQGQILKVPQAGSGLFTIAPSGDLSKVIVRFPDGSSQEYLVTGNNLTATYQENETYEDVDFQYTVVSNATLTSGKTLTITETYSGVTVIYGITGTVSGTSTTIATKQ